MVKRMQELREELGIVSQGRVSTQNSVLFHLAFRLDTETAKKFILKAHEDYMSESLWARKAILKALEGGTRDGKEKGSR